MIRAYLLLYWVRLQEVALHWNRHAAGLLGCSEGSRYATCYQRI